ncbi:MAG: type II secretion system protein [Verrucomicrobia bacterium]|nr:type II secretion system protein [Verrucomicrobiota bacterium]
MKGKSGCATKKTANASTLIELLGVIAIVAILAGLLLPTLVTAREEAESANCLSNLKQVDLSHAMYRLEAAPCSASARKKPEMDDPISTEE